MKVLLVLAAVVGTGVVISGCAKKDEQKEPAQVGTPTPTPKPKPKSTPTPDSEFTTPSTSDTPSFNDMPSPTPQASVERNYKYGVRTDRDGFVRSPDAPDQGLIDVRGFPPGSEVKDPYTGNTFLVP